MRRTGVTPSEAEYAAWTVFDGGAKLGGARAVALAIEVGRGARWPTLPWRVPGAPWLLDRAYRLVAANRNRLPGTTPWCVAHPDQCAAAPSD